MAQPGSDDYLAQRALLLELVVDPPAYGERTSVLARRLGLLDEDLGPALRALSSAGLARCRYGRVFATVAALSFELLLPARL